jgi:hypothetical protein
VKEPLIMPLVNQDSAARWAGHLAVQFDVGELLFTFVTEKPFQRRVFLLAPWVLWLARRVLFTQYVQKPPPVMVIAKDRLPLVPARHHMVNRTRIFDSQGSSHNNLPIILPGPRMARNHFLSQL